MNEKEKIEEMTKELTLLLLYINSWIEEEYGYEYRRSWKGHDFGQLNQLTEEGLITESSRAKSIVFTEEGEKTAKGLIKKYIQF